MKTVELFCKLVCCNYGGGVVNNPDIQTEFKGMGIDINEVENEVNDLLLEIAKRHSDDQ
jgi:hypothetical protein